MNFVYYAKKLLEIATKTYNYCINKKFGFEKFCCDFANLELLSKSYQPTANLSEQTEPSDEPLITPKSTSDNLDEKDENK